MSLSFQVIATFDNDQAIFMIDIPKEVGEKKFLRTIFKQLTDLELEGLIKISVCQMVCQSRNDMLDFIKRTDGKFYFNPENNPNDPEVDQWTDWKDQAINRREIKLSKQ